MMVSEKSSPESSEGVKQGARAQSLVFTHHLISQYHPFMRSPHLALRAITMVALVSMPFCATAQTKEASPYAFSTKTYRLPADDLIGGFVSTEKGKLRAPAFPPPSASHGEQEAFIKRSHGVLKEYLHLNGIALPPGSLACYDPTSQTLALRAMNTVHGMMNSLAESINNQLPKHLSWRLEIIEAPAAEVQAMMSSAQGKSDHAAQLDQLISKGKIVTSMNGESKGGQQSRTRQGELSALPTDYLLDPAKNVQTTQEESLFGTEFEIDPVIGENGSIDLNYHLRSHYQAAIPRWEAVTSGSMPKMEAQWFDRPLATISSNTTIYSGQTRLIQVWHLDGVTQPERTGNMQAAFLCCHLVSLLPLIEPRVETMLRERGESVDPTPKAVRPVADPTLPPGMEVRRFRLPSDFETMGSAAGEPPAPADPFASGAAPANEPRFVRSITSEDILKAQGIPFPTGASANFIRASNELVVRNTPANLDLVEVFVEEIQKQMTKLSQTIIQVVEADSALIRRLMRENQAVADHSAALKALTVEVAQGKARIARTAWIETKGGQQATHQNIIEHFRTAGLEFEETTEKAPADDTNKDEASKKAPITRSTGKVGFPGELDSVGFVLEIDPFIGENGITDLNVSFENDTAPITQEADPTVGESGVTLLAAPMLKRRQANFTRSISMLSGAPRIIGIYQPATTEGQPADVLHAVFVRIDIVRLDSTD